MFDDAYPLYLEQREYELKASTIKTYTDQMRSVSLHVGNMDVRKITQSMVEDLRTALLRGETSSGMPLSTSTTASTMTTLQSFFDWCIKRGYADQNPVKDLTPIKVSHKPKHVLPTEELAAFVKRLDLSEKHQLALAMYATMGLRRSEALSIVWDDIDLKGRIITIRDSKTEAGMRKLPMPEIIFDGIRKRRTAQKMTLLVYQKISQ